MKVIGQLKLKYCCKKSSIDTPLCNLEAKVGQLDFPSLTNLELLAIKYNLNISTLQLYPIASIHNSKLGTLLINYVKNTILLCKSYNFVDVTILFMKLIIFNIFLKKIRIPMYMATSSFAQNFALLQIFKKNIMFQYFLLKSISK
jgi:hypothetical protein